MFTEEGSHGETPASPTQEEIKVPRKGLQDAFEAGRSEDDTALESAAKAPLGGGEDGIQPEEVPEDEREGNEVPAIEEGTTTSAPKTKSSRGGGAARGSKGRGGGRGGRGVRGGSNASTASSRGKATSAGGRGGKRGGKNATVGKAAKGYSSGKGGVSNIGGGGGGAEVGGIGASPSNTIFPLARVSRIVKADKDIEMTSKDAIWTIAVATELFIKHLTDSAYAKARLEKKRTITYKELSAAVESQNEFFFLQDVIPQPIPLSRALEMRRGLDVRAQQREAGIFEEEEDPDPDSSLDHAIAGNAVDERVIDQPRRQSAGGIGEEDVVMDEEELPPGISERSNGLSHTQEAEAQDRDMAGI